jgi:hypothetical protein
LKVVGKLLPQIKKAGDSLLSIIVGDDELKAGVVKIKFLQVSFCCREPIVSFFIRCRVA